MKAIKLPIIDISDCFTISDIVTRLSLPMNGKSRQIVKEYVEIHNLSIDHFDYKNKQRKYKLGIKQCPVCNNTFETRIGSPREKTTCSHSCSNTLFRSGINNPNFKKDGAISYRAICFHYHGKECIICKEANIVAVHHMNEDHENNSIENLIPLCPTHHQYMHSQYKSLIIDDVERYIREFKARALPD